MRHLQYTQMFRTIAAQHPSIAHGINGKVSFVRVIRVTGDPFEDKLYLDEFLKRNRSNLSYPALIVLSYTHRYEGEKDQTKTKIFEGMFCVVDVAKTLPTSSKDTHDLRDEALDNCELISEHIITELENVMDEELQCQLSFDPESTMCEKIGIETQNVFGQSVYFSFKKKHPLPSKPNS